MSSLEIKYSEKEFLSKRYQGVCTPDGIIVEMSMPFQGRTNDKKMLRDSKLLKRMQKYFRGYCLFGDRG